MKAVVAHHQPVSYAKIYKPLSSSSTCKFSQCKSSVLAYQSPEKLGFKKFNIQCISIIKPISVKKKVGVVYASETETSSAKNVSQGWLLEPVGDGDCKHIGFKVPLPGAYEIFSSELVVGRAPEKADLVIPVATVSSLHARIQNKEGTLFVTDLDSTNGTYINEKRVSPGAVEVVPPGSLLTFGDTNLAIFKVLRIKKSLENEGESSEENKGNEDTAQQESCLDPEVFKEFKLVKRTELSHNVAKFRFALPTPDSVLGLPIGQHMSCRGKDASGEVVIKPYTPTTLDSDVGYFELVIKMYPQGRMSHHFREMREGDYLAVKGPKGRFKYQPGQVRAFGMLAGGTGITPMFQVARAILENSSDKTKVHLIYANVKSDDILLKEELDSFALKFPDQFSIYYVLNEPPEEWSGGVGFISSKMIQDNCPVPASDIQILRCGPPAMNKAMAAHLEALGYTSEMQFQF